MYHEITPDMTIGDLIQSKAYGEFARYIFTDMTPDHWNNKLSAYGYEAVGFTEALHRMEDLANTGESYVYPVYDEVTRLSNWDKEKVQLLHYPCESGDKPYILILPGGGLNRQWGLIEGLAIAAHCNQLGYSAFVLYYRTKQEPVMDKAIEDMYAAIRFIDANADNFKVPAGNYIIGGFSAGAMISQEIGTTNLGWQSAGVPKPKMVFLGYTVCQFNQMVQAYEAAEPPAKYGIAVILKKMGGPNFTIDDIAPYNIEDWIDATYPPVYLMVNEDDKTVGPASTHLLDKVFTEKGVPHITRIGQAGGHSCGLGYGLEVEGWLEEALQFAAGFQA